jgi:4-hydroxy-tetrahydrodipicolinate synthase
MPKKYYGVIPPIITPIDQNEKVDEKGFRKLLNHCVEHGIHGIFVAGTNGEAMGLTQTERDRAIRIAIDEAGANVPVMAGVMDTSTRRVIENIKRLEQMGGTCAVVTSIFYARHTSQDETIRHFEKITKEVNIDILVYNIPMFTGQKLSAPTFSKIAKMDHIMGLKDSSGDFAEFQKSLREFRARENFSVLVGSTGLAASCILEGADGYVPSIAPLFPELFVALYDSARTGDFVRTLKLNALIAETSDVLGLSKNAIAANKFAISLLGYTDKRLTQPLDGTTAEDEKAIRAKVESINNKIKESGLI